MEHVKQTGAPNRARVVFLDALGTLVYLEPPWDHLATALDRPVDDDIVRAMKAEMSFYREHSHEGRDAASVAALRERCAELLGQHLGEPIAVETMMGAIRFRPFPDSGPVLAALRERGLRLFCVSNWDYSLGEVLDGVGLGEHLDGVVTSAQAGARKPDPEVFAVALRLAGVGANEALHVGDTASEDVAGARGAGIAALLLDRDGGGDIASLAELIERVDRMPG